MDKEVWYASNILDGDAIPSLGPPSLGKRIRFRINQPFYLADLAQTLDGSRRQRRAADASWPDTQRAQKAFNSRDTWCARVGIPVPFANHDALIKRHFRTLAMLRLLIAATHPTAVVEPDPFGDGTATLRERRESQRLVLWSVGPDGIDNGGETPERTLGYVQGKRNPDIVLVAPLWHR